jgi:hypothetical protein
MQSVGLFLRRASPRFRDGVFSRMASSYNPYSNVAEIV